MRHLLLLSSFLFAIQLCSANVEDASHLKGIRSLYMNVDTSLAKDIQSAKRLDLKDIMELQLRRGAIGLNTYVMNQPDVNIPLVELSIDTSSRVAAGEYHLTLRVRDFVTIDRNGEKVVATVFEMHRSGSTGSGSKQDEVIKAQLRDVMTDFVAIFREANPK